MKRPFPRSAIAVLAIAAAASGVSRFTRASQPAAVDTSARGKAIYQERCVECHGTSGKGDGPASAFLTPRPRDFAAGKYKVRSTETGSIPTDDDLIQSVKQGLYGSAMPAWGTLLSDAQVRDVVAYVKTFSPRFATEQPAVVSLGPQVPGSPESVERGQAVYGRMQCGKCHGSDGRGENAVATDFQDDWGQPLNAANLTEPWTFHGGSTSREIYLRFRTGMSGTPMPSFKESATDAEMWDLANYVASLARTPVWSMTAEELKAQYASEEAAARTDPVKRGKYLVDTHLCAICHSPIDEQLHVLRGMYMAGGQVMRVVPFGDYPTANLTSDTGTGLGTWSDDEIKRALTRGIMRDGTRMPPYPMDWTAFGALSPDDLNAMIAYLRTIPPVSNRIPRPSRPFLPVYLWGKFKMLILQQDPPIVIFPGNVGAPGGSR